MLFGLGFVFLFLVLLVLVIPRDVVGYWAFCRENTDPLAAHWQSSRPRTSRMPMCSPPFNPLFTQHRARRGEPGSTGSICMTAVKKALGITDGAA